MDSYTLIKYKITRNPYVSSHEGISEDDEVKFKDHDDNIYVKPISQISADTWLDCVIYFSVARQYMVFSFILTLITVWFTIRASIQKMESIWKGALRFVL